MTGPRPCQTRGREGQNTSITLWGVALGHVPGPAPARHRAKRRGPLSAAGSAPPGAARGRGVPPGRACERAGLGSCVGCGAISCALRMIFLSGSVSSIPLTGRVRVRPPPTRLVTHLVHRTPTSPSCVSGSGSRDRHDKAQGCFSCFVRSGQVDFCIFHRI